MAAGGTSHDALRFLALRLLMICCLLLLGPVFLWNAVMGMVALGVALYWMGLIGTRSASAWASARGTGSSPSRAAAAARWPHALALLAAAVAASIALAVIVRELTWVGEWLADPGVAKPVLAFFLLMLTGLPAIALLSRSKSAGAEVSIADQSLTRAALGEEPRRTLIVAAIVAVALSVVNVVVLARFTPVRDSLESGGPAQTVAFVVLTIAFVAPPLAAWVVRRR